MKTNLPSSMVNSKSCTSLKCCSSVWRMLSSSAKAFGISFFSCGDRLRCAHAGDDVLALRVDQEFTVEFLHAVRRVARKRDARAGLVAGVAVDHRLHVDRGSPFGRDVVFAPINDRAIVHPRAEHRAHRAHQLLPRIDSGNCLPVRSLIRALKRTTSSFRSSTVSFVSSMSW